MAKLGQVKQKTVNGKTLKLKRKKNPVSGSNSPYVYEIHDENGEIIEENAGTRKEDALAELEETANIYSKDSDNGRSSGNGFLDQGSIF